MINQYRTLLLNLSDENNPNEFIAPNYVSLNLPSPLQAFYNLLFPNNPSRYYTEFLAFCYLQLLYAANQERYIYKLDNRVTYTLSDINDYFVPYQISTPIISNYLYPISIFGKYSVNSSIQKNYDDILISQISTIYASIYSKVNNVYYTETGTSPSPVAIKLSSNLTNSTTDTISIGGTGLSFVISGNLIDLSDASGLNWEFTAQAPFNFNFNTIYLSIINNLPIVNAMLAVDPSANDENSLNLWQIHYNPVYKFAGLLNCFVSQVNSLLN